MRLAKPEMEWRYWNYFITIQYDIDVEITWRKGADRSVLERQKDQLMYCSEFQNKSAGGIGKEFARTVW